MTLLRESSTGTWWRAYVETDVNPTMCTPPQAQEHTCIKVRRCRCEDPSSGWEEPVSLASGTVSRDEFGIEQPESTEVKWPNLFWVGDRLVSLYHRKVWDGAEMGNGEVGWTGTIACRTWDGSSWGAEQMVVDGAEKEWVLNTRSVTRPSVCAPTPPLAGVVCYYRDANGLRFKLGRPSGGAGEPLSLTWEQEKAAWEEPGAGLIGNFITSPAVGVASPSGLVLLWHYRRRPDGYPERCGLVTADGGQVFSWAAPWPNASELAVSVGKVETGGEWLAILERGGYRRFRLVMNGGEAEPGWFRQNWAGQGWSCAFEHGPLETTATRTWYQALTGIPYAPGTYAAASLMEAPGFWESANGRWDIFVSVNALPVQLPSGALRYYYGYRYLLTSWDAGASWEISLEESGTDYTKA